MEAVITNKTCKLMLCLAVDHEQQPVRSTNPPVSSAALSMLNHPPKITTRIIPVRSASATQVRL